MNAFSEDWWVWRELKDHRKLFVKRLMQSGLYFMSGLTKDYARVLHSKGELS